MKPPAPVKDPHDAAEAERIAARLLSCRGYGRVELGERLARRGVAPPVIAAVIERFAGRGWIDEQRLALDHALAGIRKGRGRGRVVRELRARGLGELAAAAWDAAVAERGGDARALLRNEVRKRLQRIGNGRPLPQREYRRVYNALLRAGHDGESVRAELEAQRVLVDDADPAGESVAFRETRDY